MAPRITLKECERIRELYADGYVGSQIAAHFGCTPATIHRHVHGKCSVHATETPRDLPECALPDAPAPTPRSDGDDIDADADAPPGDVIRTTRSNPQRRIYHYGVDTCYQSKGLVSRGAARWESRVKLDEDGWRACEFCAGTAQSESGGIRTSTILSRMSADELGRGKTVDKAERARTITEWEGR